MTERSTSLGLALRPLRWTSLVHKPSTDVKRAFGTACELAELRNLEWHDLRATFCTRLAIAGYDAFTIKALMGHRDMKTTERYIRAHRFTRQVALVEKNVHKLATIKYGHLCR